MKKKGEFVDHVIKSYMQEGEKCILTKGQIKKMYDRFVEFIANSLCEGEIIRLHGIGTLQSKVRSAGKFRNPQNGQLIEKEETKKVRFLMSELMKKRLNEESNKKQ
ncbi:MAG: HU family DNA-binding protein [Anaplasmataceae bacterium]|nr:HU family DNA-binding protein [Anaplasmataceae bacterium]